MNPNPLSVDREYLLRAARRLRHEKDSGRCRRRKLEETVEEQFQWEIPELRTDRGALSAVLDTGELKKWSAGPATSYQAVVPMNLHEVLERAEERVDENKTASKGRRSGHDPDERRHHHLTASQLRDAKSGARKLGAWMDPDGDPERGMREVGLEYLTWDPDAGAGELGDWGAALDELRRACRESGLGEGTTRKYISGLRTLLDLAATREWIPRTELHNPDWRQLPPEWSEIHNNWREILLESGGYGEGAVGAGGAVQQLLGALSRRGYDGDPAAAPWGDVVGELDAHWEGRGSRQQRRTAVRHAYRVLRDHGALDGPDWHLNRRRRENSTSLLPTGARTHLARLFGTDTRQRGLEALLHGEPVPWPDACTPHESLMRGPYGLRTWLAMRSADSDNQLPELGLPERPVGRRLRQGTFRMYLERLSHACGWLADEYDVDWAQEDLRAWADRERVDAYRTFLADQGDRSPGTQARYLRTLGYASTIMGEVAEHRDDAEAAAAFEAVADLLIGDGPPDSSRSCYVERLKDKREENGVPLAEEMKRKAIKIERTWTDRQTAAEFAYDQLARVGVARLEQFTRDYGPLAEQRTAVVRQNAPYRVEGARCPMGRTWAKRARNLLIWFGQLVVPYRTGTLAELDRQDLEPFDPMDPEPAPGSLLSIHVHRTKRKAPNMTWHEPILGRPDTETLYPVELAYLYLTEGGPRDVLLTRPGGSRWDPTDGDCRRHPDEHRRHPDEIGDDRINGDARGDGLREPLFPNSLSKADYARMSGSTVRTAIKRVARKALEGRPDLLDGVSYDDLTERDGVLIPHAFRHAYGKWRLVDGGEGQLDEVVQILDHADATMLLRVYAGTDASDYNVGAVAAESLKRRGVL